MHTTVSGAGSAGADTVISGGAAKSSPQPEVDGKGAVVPFAAEDEVMPEIGAPANKETVYGNIENGGGEWTGKTTGILPDPGDFLGAGQTEPTSVTPTTGDTGSGERSVEPLRRGPAVSTPVSGKQRRRRSSSSKSGEVNLATDSDNVNGDNKSM